MRNYLVLKGSIWLLRQGDDNMAFGLLAGPGIMRLAL